MKDTHSITKNKILDTSQTKKTISACFLMLYNFLGYIMSVLNGNICAPPSWKIFLLETEAIFRRKIHSQLIYEHNAKIK